MGTCHMGTGHIQTITDLPQLLSEYLGQQLASLGFHLLRSHVQLTSISPSEALHLVCVHAFDEAGCVTFLQELGKRRQYGHL